MRAHRVADLAEQSGLSKATVDRVLHGRGASPRAIAAVEQAVLDLDRQQSQLRLAASTLMLDVVVQAPRRFSSQVRRAVEAELPQLRPATVRARFHLRESGSSSDLAGLLDRIGTRGRGSQGVLLKAPDHPEIAAAVKSLHARGVPVVTLVTDVQGCPRIAYCGLDNAAAGATAAYLINLVLPADAPGPVVVTSTQSSFFGERERWNAFATRFGALAPQRRVLLVPDADGLDERVADLVGVALSTEPVVAAVYSIGGGNAALVELLTSSQRTPAIYVAHDLDRDNIRLLRSGGVQMVLHHELRGDLREACTQLLRHHRVIAGSPRSVCSAVHVITPENLPGGVKIH